MMTRSYSSKLWLLATLLLVGGAAVLLARHARVQTDLLAVLPATERSAVAERAVAAMRDVAMNRAVFLIGHAEPARARRAAAAFARELEAGKAFARVQLELPGFDPRSLAQPHRAFRFGLLTEPDRRALAEEDFDATQWLVRRLSEPLRFGPGGGLAQDPFGFFGNFLAGLPYGSLRLSLEDGMLVARDDSPGGWEYILVSAELPGSAFDDRAQGAALAATAAAEGKALTAAPGAEVLRTGAVFFAAAARSSAQRDVEIIGAGSLLGIILLMGGVFRSLRPLLLGLLTVAIGLVAGASATMFAYGELHLLTLVFGASLIGEAMDYSIQYFGAYAAAGPDWDAQRGAAAVRPALTLALGTSLLGYAALLLTPFPAVAQIALFAMAGLATSYLAVVLLLPRLLREPYRRDISRLAGPLARLAEGWGARVRPRGALVLAALALVACAPGWLRLQSDDDVRTLSIRSESLAAQEARIRALTGVELSTRFFVVEGATAEETLRVEERLASRLRRLAQSGVLSSWQAVSSFVPSTARQEENRALLKRTLNADVKSLERAFQDAGLREGIAGALTADYQASEGRVLTPQDWLPAPAAAPFRHLWLGKTEGGFATVVVPLGTKGDAIAAAARGLAGVSFVDKAASVSKLFGEYRRAFGIGLGMAMLVVLGLLAFRYGASGSFAVLLPAALGVAAALAASGYAGAPLTLFSFLAFMLVLGVGVNYSIFLVEGRARSGATGLAVLLCAATTVLSFGLLAFSQTPALSRFGATLLVGVAVAVLAAPLSLSLSAARRTRAA
jgi:predicted exporter